MCATMASVFQYVGSVMEIQTAKMDLMRHQTFAVSDQILKIDA